MAERDTYEVTIFKRNGAMKVHDDVIEEYDLGDVHCIVLAERAATGNLKTEKYHWGRLDHISTEHRPHAGTTKRRG